MSDPVSRAEKYASFAIAFSTLSAGGLQLPSFENLIGLSDVNFRRMMGEPNEAQGPQFRETQEAFQQILRDHNENRQLECLVFEMFEIYRKSPIDAGNLAGNTYNDEVKQHLERFSREFDDAKSTAEKEAYIRRFAEVPTVRGLFLASGSFLAKQLMFIQMRGNDIVVQYVNFISNPNNTESYNALMRVYRREIRDYYNNILQKQDSFTTEVCHFPKPVFTQGFRILAMNGVKTSKFQVSTHGGLMCSFNLQKGDEVELKANLAIMREVEGDIHCSHAVFPVFRWQPVSTIFKYVFMHTKTSFDPTNSVDAECLIASEITPYITELNVYMNRSNGLYRITFVMILIPAIRK